MLTKHASSPWSRNSLRLICRLSHEYHSLLEDQRICTFLKTALAIKCSLRQAKRIWTQQCRWCGRGNGICRLTSAHRRCCTIRLSSFQACMMTADKESLLRVTRGYGKVVWQQNIFQKATHTFCPHGSDHKTRRSTSKHRIQAIEESNKYRRIPQEQPLSTDAISTQAQKSFLFCFRNKRRFEASSIALLKTI